MRGRAGHSTPSDDRVSGLVRLVLVAATLLLSSGCQPASVTSGGEPPIVRVRLLAAQERVMLAAWEPPMFRTSQDGGRRLSIPGGDAVPVTLAPEGWRVGSEVLPGGEMVVVPNTTGSVSVNGQAYRGSYRFVPVGNNRFDVVNDVDVDSYLKSVVPREMLRNWHPEAFRAQAIVARTYALYEARTAPAGKHYDLHADVRSQVYGGLASETDKAVQAVDSTAGVVLAYGPRGAERIFKTYFSACCGGIGQNVTDAFRDRDLPPLRARNVGDECSASPRFNWAPVVLSKDELTRRIRAWGTDRNHPIREMSRLERIDIATVNQFGRPVQFILTDSRGARYSLGSEETRWACNADAGSGPKLMSSFFKPIASAEVIQFTEGRGFGHGVGMCQWCAQMRALRGMRHEDIAVSSYPGSVLKRAY